MAMRNPVGRVNYQPNSFGEGPRESPQRGFSRLRTSSRARSAGCARKALRIIIVRLGSSSSARPAANSITSRQR